jgi:hypothetical protein
MRQRGFEHLKQVFATNYLLYALFWVIPRRSEFHIPMFRNTLSHLHSQVGVENNLLTYSMEQSPS